jgi:high affinity Mn2+ porin
MEAAPETYAVHVQLGGIVQYHPAFRSPYRGSQSLDPGSRGNEAALATGFFGFRPWLGAEVWANPEVDQGFGLSNTLGLAGFPNALSSRVGSSDPYVRLQRVFIRQTINLGGGTEQIQPDLNVLGGSQALNRVVITIGKFGVTDVFDTNRYAHDPRSDFLNWTIVDAGAFDYAADAWGYSYGGAAEWYQDWWTLRAGYFNESRVPNGKALETGIGRQYQLLLEAEERHEMFGQPGKLKLLVFSARNRSAKFSDAVTYGRMTGRPADPSPVRRPVNRTGAALNLEQQLTPELGMFARLSLAEGGLEPYEYTDVDQSVSVGLSLSGTRWGRPNDTIGLAGVLNGISRRHKDYLRAGGLGILVGDGKLPNSGSERVLETYYSLAVLTFAKLSLNYQFVSNPAYNRDRGPVSIIAARLNAQF